MKQYKLVNNLVGWCAFLVAAITYCCTVEPTASFWDCPEFITTGYKLEVGHPPGAPFFMLTANFFSLFAEPDTVAYMVNIMSAILSAGGILFLFWSITHLVRKLVVGNSQEMSKAQMVTILASGLVGALAYTWSDTYWFSAVEGEVYGYSSLFTAVVFWLILKWEDNADSPHSDRWLILIAYLVGLSIGVHLLNLLCIPAIVLVMYYKKFPDKSNKYTLLALIISAALVAVVLYGVVPGVVKVGGWFELLFVNVLGMTFNTGLYVYLIVLFGVLAAGIYYTEKFGEQTDKTQKIVTMLFIATVALLGIPFYGHNVLMSIVIGAVVIALLYYAARLKDNTRKFFVSFRAFNTAFLCMLFIMIGYSSYALIVIRSAANTPMDQNSPEDIFTLGTYLNREQYGTRPLFYGQSYGSEVLRDKDGKPVEVATSPVYIRKDGKYEISEYNTDYQFAQNMLFPRMWSSHHKNYYESWTGRIKNTVPSQDGRGRVTMPTQLNNLTFFINYQVNHMYWRYFMWNFVGRQNDVQSHGEAEHGNWITGIKFLDEMRLGDLDKLPEALKENKGRNVFFALPLILGILGIAWQLKKGKEGKRQCFIVGMLFFMTGLAIVLYLNQTPMQPRERDYAYAGSFYAFAIWIGMGVAAIIHFIQQRMKKESLPLNIAVSAACLLVPVQMVSQTWDDHDRRGRYACRDFGQNYLNSLPDNSYPIIFTCGDNDTFPLWYNQEVEGVRTDTRVCNLSYIQADWYIDQMKRPAYESPSLPISWERDDYIGNTNQVIYIIPEVGTKHIKDFLAKHPEKAELIGNVHDVKNITKYWIAGANDKEKSPERKVVEEIIEYIKPKMIKDGERLISQGRSDFNNPNLSDEGMELAEYRVMYGDLIVRIARDLTPSSAVLPTGKLQIPIDAEAVKRSGMKIPKIYSQGIGMPEFMEIDMSGVNAVYRHEMLIFDMLANANWERPIYVAITVGTDNYPEVLQDYFVLEGLSYRITPFNWTSICRASNEIGLYDSPVDTEKFYDNVVSRFKWGGVKENKDYYADETIRRMITTHRTQIATLAQYMHNDIIVAGDTPEEQQKKKEITEKIITLLEKWYTEFPGDIVVFDTMRDGTVEVAKIYKMLLEHQKELEGTSYFLGDETLDLLQQRSVELAAAVIKNEYEYLKWNSSRKPRERSKQIEEHRMRILMDGVHVMLSDTEEEVARSYFDKYVGYSLEEVYNELIKHESRKQ